MTHLSGSSTQPTRRRRLLALAAALTVPAVLAGCSQGGDGGTGGDDGAQGAEITYWLWDSNQQPAYQQCADAFTEESGIDVTIEQYGWADYWQGLTTGFASGTAPDVFTDHLSYYPQFVSQGQLMDLTENVENDDVDLDAYQEGLAELWVDEEGRRYGLPKDFDTVATFYNEQMVTDAGYTPEQLATLEWNPEDGGTFEELVAALTVDANGVRGNEPGFDKSNVAVYGLALSGNGLNASGQQTWAPYALSTGWYFGDQTPWTSEWNYDDEEFTDTMAWYRSLTEKGYMPGVEIALSELDPANGYLAGRYALVTDGSWMNSTYLGQSDVPTKVAPTPIGPSGERASVFNGLADGIWAGTDEPEAAWEWVKYLASADCQDVVAEAAVVFPAVTSSTEKAVQAFADKGWDVTPFTVQVDEGTTALLPIADHWADINSDFTSTTESFLQGSSDVDEYAQLNERVNALFQ